MFADFVAALHGATAKVAVGDPTRREHWMGPVIDATAVARYEDAAAQVRALGADGAIVEGGLRLDRNELAHGLFVAPTVARAPLDHPLWSRELFAPFVLVAPVATIEEGIARANAGPFGLTAGFYGSAEETERFFGSIEAGVDLREPAAGRDHGRVAGLPAVRRVEGFRIDRPWRRVALLPAAIPPRAVADARPPRGLAHRSSRAA